MGRGGTSRGGTVLPQSNRSGGSASRYRKSSLAVFIRRAKVFGDSTTPQEDNSPKDATGWVPRAQRKQRQSGTSSSRDMESRSSIIHLACPRRRCYSNRTPNKRDIRIPRGTGRRGHSRSRTACKMLFHYRSTFNYYPATQTCTTPLLSGMWNSDGVKSTAADKVDTVRRIVLPE